MPETKTNVPTTEEPMITKMSVKALGCMPTGGDPADDTKPNVLCVIGGKATGVKMGEGPDGRLWTAIVGAFRGVNVKTGVAKRAGKLFLPSGIQEVVEAQVAMLGEGSEGHVKFLMQISSVKSTSKIGYGYEAKNLIPISTEEDELADLIAATTEKFPALAAPVDETKQLTEAPKSEAPAAPAAKGKGK